MKIVREHYPTSRLPEDLREEIGDNAMVTVTIVVEPVEGRKSDWFSRHAHIQRDHFKSTEEVNEYVRSLRDEWSHRER
ncbi:MULTISPECIES: hypothetical protein [Methylosinus]|uniref:Uncharacterized protein n=1 Tax=Methylosinus trichosporium (strain ATCC 35070 / NCIMB 11131 / UNIQEM 75 / OB3b) TaxID=595536 RepID=A0A2D2CXQ3_METT3|nr:MULTISPECIES: hypothetical protein [Methylosinus]ATQ67505.1 hypothetical protein CQW49_06070 [Methylosinus trichosporium OB3b]OBS51458.1 hypothetical protein A8B73_16185 [Methylosinus sp. 3S-1]